MMPRRGRGMSLVEALVALALLGFALLASTAVITWADRVEARARQRVVALELAGSLAERLRVVPYASLQDVELDLSTEYVPLPDPVATLDVTEDEELQSKRVDVVVTWRGDMPGKVTLPTLVGSVQAYR